MSLLRFKTEFERRLPMAVCDLGEKSPLRDACEYALMGGGKRLRPVLVLMIADALGNGLDVFPAACSVEFFHTASLIADDLPCMDNDAIRRGRASLHKHAGETTAILASYTLIAAGYEGIYRNAEMLKNKPAWAFSADARAMQSLEAATRCAGLKGATQGQYSDLFISQASLPLIKKIIYQKTTTLFEVAFILGWLFGGGEEKRLTELQGAAAHLGLAFQIADDLDDGAQDASHANPMNIAIALGKEAALSLFDREIAALSAQLQQLGLWTDPAQELVVRLSHSIAGAIKR